MGVQLDELKALLTVNSLPAFTPHHFRSLIDRYGTMRQALACPASDWMASEGMTFELAKRLQAKAKTSFADQEIERIRSLGIHIWIQEDFPHALREIPDPPIVLYVRGTWHHGDCRSLAVVGTRKATPYGEAVTRKFVKGLVRASVTTVSGMARGIDTMVHQETLAAGGRTIAVLGCGLDRCYPPENRFLMQAIVSRGLVVSEFPLGAEPAAWHFPRRNRIISGLARGTLVVEAPEKSGALITARLAAEQGRDVFCIPGPLGSEQSRGTHFLIKSGAQLVETPDEILQEIGWEPAATATVPLDNEPLSVDEKKVLSFVGMEPVSWDTLMDSATFSAGQLSQHLLTLELKGYIKTLPGKAFVKKNV